jgi:hypothetical protein
MLSILASFAQEELQSMSNNIKWAIQKRYKQGLPNSKQNLYGYRWHGDELIIVPEEAAIVREIYANYLKEISAEKTAKLLTARGVTGFRGGEFKSQSVRSILLNNTYNGTLQLQKGYVVDPLTKKSKRNKGELPTYLVENHHEAIIPMAVWEAVVEERARRLAEGATSNWSLNTSCFTSNIKCGCCEMNFQRKRRRSVKVPYPYWQCASKNKYGADHCPTQMIRESVLKDISSEILGLAEFDEAVFKTQIDHLEIKIFELTFFFKDGHQEKRHYENKRTPKLKWTDAQKAKQSKLLLEKWQERKAHGKENYNNSGNNQ